MLRTPPIRRPARASLASLAAIPLPLLQTEVSPCCTEWSQAPGSRSASPWRCRLPAPSVQPAASLHHRAPPAMAPLPLSAGSASPFTISGHHRLSPRRIRPPQPPWSPLLLQHRPPPLHHLSAAAQPEPPHPVRLFPGPAMAPPPLVFYAPATTPRPSLPPSLLPPDPAPPGAARPGSASARLLPSLCRPDLLYPVVPQPAPPCSTATSARSPPP